MPSSLEPPGLWLMPGLRVGCPGPLVSPELKMAAGGPATVLMANAYNVSFFFFFLHWENRGERQQRQRPDL